MVSYTDTANKRHSKDAPKYQYKIKTIWHFRKCGNIKVGRCHRTGQIYRCQKNRQHQYRKNNEVEIRTTKVVNNIQQNSFNRSFSSF